MPHTKDSLHTPDRVAALQRYRILGTPPETAFDRITELVAHTVDTPLAWLSFVDDTQQWFKSVYGVPEGAGHAVPLEKAIGMSTLQSEDGVVVQQTDPKKKQLAHPFIDGGTLLGFYVGVPLRTADGYPVGTLAAADPVPRMAMPDVLSTVHRLGEIAMQTLELKQHAHASNLLKRIRNGVYALDTEWRFTYVNEQAATWLESARTSMLGACIWTLFPEAKDSLLYQKLHEAMRTQRRVAFSFYQASLDQWFEIDAHPSEGGLTVYFVNITGKKQSEAEQTLLARALKQSNEAVLIFEAHPVESLPTTIMYANRACEALTGYSRQALTGADLQLLHGPDTESDVLETAYVHMQAGESWSGRITHHRHDGRPFVVHWNMDPVRDNNGVITHWVAVQRDVTKQHRRDTALRRQRNLLAQTQRLAGGWTLDRRTGTLTWSEEVYRIHDLPPDTPITPDDALSFYPPEARDQIQEMLTKCLHDGTPYDVELPIRTATGTTRWIRTVGGVIEHEDDAILKLGGAVQDITKRRQAYQKLRKRERRFRGVTDSIPGAVFCLHVQAPHSESPTYTVDFISRYAETLFGARLNRRSDAFDWFVQRIPKEHRSDFHASIQKALQDHTRWEYEMPFEKPTGKTIWLRGVAMPEERPSEHVFNGVLLDVTERKHTEQELIAAKNEAEEMNRLKSAFLANMSHEIRTPLTAIIGFAEVLGDMDLDGPADRFSNLIRRSGRRLLSMLNSVLDLSQLEAEAMDLQPTTLSVNGWMHDMVHEVAAYANESNVTVDVQAPSETVEAKLDPQALQRVLMNLLNNAVKFTPEGGTVTVRLEATPKTLTVEVADTGVGIEEAFLPHLFDAFKQESTGSGRVYEGSGLGLTITKRLVNLMNGTITVDSTKGEGTTFIVTLPRYMNRIDPV